MPEAENKTQQVGVAEVTTLSMPTEIGRVPEVRPTGTNYTSDPLNIKMVPLGKEKVLNKNSILAMHSLNLPRKERLILGMKMFKFILAKVEAYDYEHDKEYFQVFPDLVVAKPDEDWASMNSSEFLYFRRELISRLVNKLLNYYDGVLALDGALANLCILSNVNGTGKYKTFGLACKVSYINTATNTFDDFVQPKGAVDYITGYSKFAVGETNQNLTFVSIPEWDTSIFGNRGQHTFNWSDIIAGWCLDGDHFALPSSDTADYDTYKKLLKNIAKTITRYGYDISLEAEDGVMKHAAAIAHKIDPDNASTVVPSVSHLENGAVLSASAEFGKWDSWSMNADTSVIYKNFTQGIRGGDGQYLHSDNIINRAWDTYNYWVTYMQEFFGDIFQRNSVIRNFMVNDLKEFFEPGLPGYKFYSKVNVDNAFDAVDMQKKRMVYKAKGAATTATICRWEPIYCDADETPDSEENFPLNFERIRFDADSEDEVLSSAKEHVRLTPTQFDSIYTQSNAPEEAEDINTFTPAVLNGLGSASYLIDADGVDTPIHAPLGKFASMLDRTMAYASKNPHNNSISVIGAEPKDVKENFVDKAENHSIVFDKDPSNVWVPTLPLIDSSDPYQCGWNIIISEESVHPNIWESYFRNPDNYLKRESDNTPVAVYEPTAGSGTGANPNSQNSIAFAMDEQKRNKCAHVANPDYMALVKHAKVFVGDAIWETPESLPTHYQSGTYAEAMVFSRDGDIGTDATNLRALLIDKLGNWQSPEALDEAALEALDPDDLIQYMLGLSACVNDPSIPGDKIANIMSAFDWWWQWWRNYFSESLLPDWRVMQWTFAPSYGPVCPVVYDVPAHLPCTNADQEIIDGRKPVDSYTDDTSDISTAISAPEMMQGATSGYPLDQEYTRFALDSQTSVAQYLLWFLDNFSFTKTTKDVWNMYISDTKVALPGFSGPAKRAFALLSRGRVFFMGSGDFDSVFRETARMSLEPDSPSFGAVKVDMGNLVTPPKVVTRKMELSKLSSWRDRGRSIRSIKSAFAIDKLSGNKAGKNDTSDETSEKKQSSSVKGSKKPYQKYKVGEKEDVTSTSDKKNQLKNSVEKDGDSKDEVAKTSAL